MKITLAQIPSPAGAIATNTGRVLDALAVAAQEMAQVLVLPDEPLTGDASGLHDDPAFAAEVFAAEARVREMGVQAGASVGIYAPPPEEEPRSLSDYSFDLFAGVLAEVAEGAWLTFDWTSYPLADLAGEVAKRGGNVLIIAGRQAYRVGAPERRRAELQQVAREHGVMVVFCNRVGAQDSEVYYGGSLVIAADGTVVHQSPLFTENVVHVDLDVLRAGTPPSIAEWPTEDEQTWTAMVVGTRDYVHGNGFTDVVIGLSGGIDSAVVAAIAVDALGAEHVHGIGMPGPYSSDGSVTDAQELARNLGVRFDIASIKDTYEAEVAALGDLLDGPGSQVAKENIQARLRALHLFTVANARNALVLNTCQKSEDAVGYATYLGDAAGAIAPMVDLLKRDVYRLARWRNTVSPVIPADSIDKAPSAELAPGQQDTDTLPPYPVLDTILDRYLVHGDAPDDLIKRVTDLPEAAGRDVAADVQWVLTAMDRSEWKRRQAPLGPSLTSAPFAERRVPVTNGRRHALSRR